MGRWPSRIQIWDPLQLNKSGPFIIIRKVTTMSHKRETEYYEGCPESIQPFLISCEPVVWPWCNLAASQRRPYCTSVNSHSPVGLVSWQRDAVDWACVLCDRRIHNDLASRSALSRQCACPFYSSRAGFCWKSTTSPRSVSPPAAHIWLPATSGFSQT